MIRFLDHSPNRGDAFGWEADNQYGFDVPCTHITLAGGDLNKHILWLFLMGGTWWLWSGKTDFLIVVFGVVSVLITVWLFSRMDNKSGENSEYRLGLRPVFYLPWILWEIIKANVDVIKVICRPKMDISPRMIRVKASQKTDIGQVIYANSITLTPGTITLDVRDGEMLVHALTKDTAAGLETGDMDRRVTRLEGGS